MVSPIILLLAGVASLVTWQAIKTPISARRPTFEIDANAALALAARPATAHDPMEVGHACKGTAMSANAKTFNLMENMVCGLLGNLNGKPAAMKWRDSLEVSHVKKVFSFSFARPSLTGRCGACATA